MGGMNETLTDNDSGSGKPDETALSFDRTSQTTDTAVSGLAADTCISGLAADTSVSGLPSVVANYRETNDVYGPTSDTRISENDAVHGASGHRRNGKVARLPKGVREQINELMDDGVDYEEIIKTLGDAGKGLTKHNVSQWARGGYCDWVKEQERKVLLAGNFEKVVDTIAKADPEEIPDLVTKLLAARVGGVLSDLTPQEIQVNSEKDPRNLVRLLALVPKLSREALRTRKYREAMEREKAAEIKQLDPKRELEDAEHLAIVDHVNRLFGLRQYRKPKVEAAMHGKPAVSAPTVAQPTETGGAQT